MSEDDCSHDGIVKLGPMKHCLQMKVFHTPFDGFRVAVERDGMLYTSIGHESILDAHEWVRRLIKQLEGGNKIGVRL